MHSNDCLDVRWPRFDKPVYEWRSIMIGELWKFPGSFQEVSQSGSCGLLVRRRSGRRGGGIDLLSIPHSFRGDRVRMPHLHTSRHARRTHWQFGTASQDAGRGAFFVDGHAGWAGKPSGQGHGQREGPWRYLALRVGAGASMAEMPLRRKPGAGASP